MGMGKNVEFCPDVFKSIEKFDKTIGSMFMKIGMTFKCNICPKTTPNLKTQMKQHAEIHMKGQHFICTLCGKRWRTRETARQHVYRVHTQG